MTRKLGRGGFLSLVTWDLFLFCFVLAYSALHINECVQGPEIKGRFKRAIDYSVKISHRRFLNIAAGTTAVASGKLRLPSKLCPTTLTVSFFWHFLIATQYIFFASTPPSQKSPT
jgi:hypothetical protein